MTVSSGEQFSTSIKMLSWEHKKYPRWFVTWWRFCAVVGR